MARVLQCSKITLDHKRIKIRAIFWASNLCLVIALSVLIGNVRVGFGLKHSIELMDTFGQETARATEWTDSEFKMKTPHMREAKQGQLRIIFLLGSAVVFAAVIMGCTCFKAIIRASRGIILILVFFIGTLVLHGIISISANKSSTISNSQDLRNEVFDLLEQATDKYPVGLAIIEEERHCCGVISKTNRTVFGSQNCDKKLEKCTSVMLGEFGGLGSMSTITTYASVVIIIVVLIFTLWSISSFVQCSQADGEQRIKIQVEDASGVDDDDQKRRQDNWAFNSGDSTDTYFTADEDKKDHYNLLSFKKRHQSASGNFP